ncbi:MAG: GntR family transcriptional regulator [Gemmatimonadetes bacterium]|nr:GntR family transcriptional regulator [Gemmatimonadota bacterium]
MNSADPAIESVASRPRGDRASEAYRRLQALIVEGALSPGAPIIERETAKRLGVSRTPLRVALGRLEKEGYVVNARIDQYSRTVVAPLTAEDGRELFDIVGALEALSARRAALLDTVRRGKLVRDLKALNRELRLAARERPPDARRVNDLDLSFHRRYVEAAGGTRLTLLHESVKPQAARYELVYTSALLGEIDTSVAEHAVIIGAIETGDPEAAQGAVETNWRNAAERLSRVIERLGEKGSW